MAKTHFDNDKNNNNHMDMTCERSTFFTRCPLVSLSVPESKQSTMCRILKPFMKHFDVLGDAFEVVTKENCLISNSFDGLKSGVPSYTVSQDQMSSPAMSVMLFLPEFGKSQAEKVRLKFQKAPWHLHHSIQLQKQSSSDIVGKQDFYFLSRRFPLWSVCTAPHLSRVLRINIFVRRFSAMMEFYRLVTGSEMESSKPGFCVFTLNTQIYDDDGDSDNIVTSSRISPSRNSETKSNIDGVSFELALKQCPHINPFSITDAYLTFPVSDIISLRTIMHNYIRPLTSTHYLVHDPDGNPVILYDLSAIPSHQHESNRQQNCSQHFKNDHHPPSHIQNTSRMSSVRSILEATSRKYALRVEKASIRSESLDSGRFSDLETLSHCTTDLDQCMAQLFPNEECNDALSPNFESSSCKWSETYLDNTLELINDFRGTLLHDSEADNGPVRKVSIGDFLSVEDKTKKKNTERDKFIRDKKYK